MVAANKKAKPLQYAVLWVRNSDELYVGPSLSETADALVPGTCYGTGTTAADALTDARCLAYRARKARKRSGRLWREVETDAEPARAGDPSREKIERMCAELRNRRGSWE